MGRSKRKVVVLRAGMTCGEAREAVRTAWPLLDLTFFRNIPAYYHNGYGLPETATSPADVLTAVEARAGEVRITGDTTNDELVQAVTEQFKLMPEVGYDLFEERGAKDRPTLATVSDAQAEAEIQRRAFAAKHGREPTPADRIYQDGWHG